MCGDGNTTGPCCFEAEGSSVSLVKCNPALAAQQWRLQPNGSVINSGNMECLSTLTTPPTSQVHRSNTGTIDAPLPMLGSTGANAPTAQFANDIQLALANPAAFGCSPTADPPTECCMWFAPD